MEFPKAAMWMVGIGVLGLAGTGVAFVLDQMPEQPASPAPTATPEPVDPADYPGEPTSGESEPSAANTEKTEPAPEPEPKGCRALVNVRSGGAHDDLYDYRVMDVRFAADGRVESTSGPGLAVKTQDGLYATQLGLENPRGLPLQVVQTSAYQATQLAEVPLWTYPRLEGGLEQNDDYMLWPVHQQKARVRATVDEYVSVQRETINSEGGMRQESGVVLDVQSGESVQPLRLNLSAIRGRAAAFPHQKVASEEGSAAIWERFVDRGEGDFLLRLANGPGKSVQPEAGVCCYEGEGTSQMIFARLERGAFALMAPGYLSRPSGYVRAGDGCGEFGWDGQTVYARTRGTKTWMPVTMSSPEAVVHEFLGAYWIPTDHPFAVAKQPDQPAWPTQEQLAADAGVLIQEGREALEKGEYADAMVQLRSGLRLRMMVGQTVGDDLRADYATALAQSSHRDKTARYFEFRMRASGSAREKQHLRALIAEHAIPVEFDEQATP